MTDDFSSPAREREPGVVSRALNENAGEARVAQKTLGSLYNFVKSVAKVEDLGQAAQKLAAVVAKTANDLDQKNSKGSTALHACGYLKRWDLAKILLDAGASPTLRNSAGHSFFLTAVREPLAPWRELFAGHPELIEKHERFLAKNAPMDSAAAPSAKESRPSNFSLDATAGQKALAAYIDEGLWEEESPKLTAQDLAGKPLDAQRQAKLAREMPLSMALDLVEQGAKLGHEALATLAERCAQAQDWSGASRWGRLTAGASQASRERLMEGLLREGLEESLIDLAGAGWAIEEEFIEQCEEFERYDLADALIDLRAQRRLEPAPKVAAKPCSGQKNQKRPAKKSKAPAVRKAGSRKPAMIAKLDAPLREASDYGYHDRKKPAKAPVIIVKKARSILGADPSVGDS